MAVETIDYEKCSDCGICYDICPMDVYGLMHAFRQADAKPRVYIKYPEDCMCCYLCELDCPDDAIYVSPYRSFEVTLPY